MKRFNTLKRWNTFLFLMVLIFLVSYVTCTQTDEKSQVIQWQAHRGGGAHDAPENTLAAFYYTWKLGGIPEADIRTTKDSVIICLHDATLARTTTAPVTISSKNVNTLIFKQIRRWDASVKFSANYQGEEVPSLSDVFRVMQDHSERQMYLDLKDVHLRTLGRMIDSYGIGKQILIASPRQDDCKSLKALAKNVRTMLWIGGTASEIQEKFQQAAASGFNGLDQVQLHLNDKKEAQGWRYELEPEILKAALQQTQKSGRDLEVFVKQFDEPTIHALLDMGIRWFATDEPQRFVNTIATWKK